MKPYFSTALGSLYHGDCLEIIPTLDNIDVVNTDPPYNLKKDYGRRTKNINEKISDNLSPEDYQKWFSVVFYEINKKMENGYLYCSHSDQGIWDAKPAIERNGFKYVQVLVWWGKNGYSMALHTKTWGFRHELILFFRKGDPVPLDIKKKGVWFQSVIEATRPQTNYKDKRYHICQKPLSLYDTILMRTPGKIVLDPFMGSGTTAIVCERQNREWIGIELSEENCEITAKRLELEASQLKLCY